MVAMNRMYNFVISIAAGILACVAYWIDHTMVNPETKTEPICQKTLGKLFCGGAAVAYATITVMGSHGTANVAAAATPGSDTIQDVIDTIKTGQPSF